MLIDIRNIYKIYNEGKESEVRALDGVSLQITENSDGEQYVLLLNNSGIARSVADGEVCLPEGALSAMLTVAGGKTLCKLEGNGTVTTDDNGCHISIPSGGWLFAKL